MFIQLQNEGLKKSVVQHSGRPGKFAQTTGTLGTAQIAGSGGFNTYKQGLAALHHFTLPARKVKTQKEQAKIVNFVNAEFAEYVEVILYQIKLKKKVYGLL